MSTYTYNQEGNSISVSSTSGGFSLPSNNTFYLDNGDLGRREDVFVFTFQDGGSFYLTDFSELAGFGPSSSSVSVGGIRPTTGSSRVSIIDLIGGSSYASSFDVYNTATGELLINDYTPQTASGYAQPLVVFVYNGGNLSLQTPTSPSGPTSTSTIDANNGSISYSSYPAFYAVSDDYYLFRYFDSINSGYFSEASGQGFGLEGNIVGSTGAVTLSNGASLQQGTYGTFYIQSGSRFFSYTPDTQKIKPLNSGEEVTDTFELFLTSPNGIVDTRTYTVTIQGDGSDPTPTKSIVITGNRGTVSGKPGIIVDGITTELDDGTKVVPWVRFPGQTGYTEGSARPVVTDGEFSWSRKTGKKAYLYFTTEDQSVTSNKDIIPARLMLGSTFDGDPITNSARYDKDSAVASDFAVSNVISIGGAGKKNGSNHSKTADNLMAAGRKGLVADSNATVFSASSNALDFSSDTSVQDRGRDLMVATSTMLGKVEALA